MKRVKQVNPQHDNSPKNNLQNISNKTNRQSGNLAIKPSPVVDINNILLEEQEKVRQALLNYGLSQRVSGEIIANWSVDYLQQKLALVEKWRRHNPQAVRNLPGFVRQAITEDYRIEVKAKSEKAPNTIAMPAKSRYRRIGGPKELLHDKHSNSTKTTLETSARPAQANTTVSQLYYTVSECQVLWERICNALSERFRRPDLLPKLQGAFLEIQPQTRQACVRLSDSWAIGYFPSAERALLQMVFSQEVGPGYRLEVI